MKCARDMACWLGLILAGSVSCSSVFAQAAPTHTTEPLPYLLLRDERYDQRIAPTLGTEIVRTQYALPGLPAFLTAGASWTPLREFTVRTGVSSAAVTPCPASLDQDCAWLASELPADTGFTVGASWRPLDALEVDVDYASGPALAPGTFAGEVSSALLIKEDLSLSCRLDTASWGDLELGVALSRWDEATPRTAEQENSAALGVAWELGAFRGDVTSRFTQFVGAGEPVWNTFDVNFAWRTPWNARLSIGATNLLDAPAPAEARPITEPRVEDFLGRVPYVRYQQDL